MLKCAGHEVVKLHALYGGTRRVVGLDLAPGMVALAQASAGSHCVAHTPLPRPPPMGAHRQCSPVCSGRVPRIKIKVLGHAQAGRRTFMMQCSCAGCTLVRPRQGGHMRMCVHACMQEAASQHLSRMGASTGALSAEHGSGQSLHDPRSADAGASASCAAMAMEAHVADAACLDAWAPAAAVLSVFGLQQLGALAPQVGPQGQGQEQGVKGSRPLRMHACMQQLRGSGAAGLDRQCSHALSTFPCLLA